jgi:hypothetical protein
LKIVFVPIRISADRRKTRFKAPTIVSSTDVPVRHAQLDVHLVPPEGRFTYEQMVPIATQLFVNGISGMDIEPRKTTRKQ